ncbi:MAG: PilZ domain-containing protein, partial [Myxococcales bacterium]|nr:PilZ domain-containing protein [Myxococcales bacterium]
GMQLPPDEPIILRVPTIREGDSLRVLGRVVTQRPSTDGGYHTGVAFDSLDDRARRELGTLLADLMFR